MTDRLKQARTDLEPDSPASFEYTSRLGGYLDAAITLIGVASADAMENLDRNRDCEVTKKAVTLLAQASERLELLVAVLCPLTAQVKPPETASG